jgi:cytochrome P450
VLRLPLAEARDLVPQVELPEAEGEKRRARFPLGAAIEFPDLEEHGRAAALDRLRETEPVSWVPALGGWLVTSHPLGRNVLARTSDFTVWAVPNLVRASLGVMMLTSDPPDHERQRQPFDEPFRMRAVRERFEERVSDRAERLLDEIEPRGSCELVVDFAAPFAIGVAGDILGLSLDDVPKIQGFYEAFAGAMTYDGDPEPQRRADAARTAFNEILLGELARAREQPDGSITSAVTNDPATELSDDAIVAQLRVILFGAIETVESMAVNAVLLLLGHPAELDAVLAEPSLVPNAVEEGMRLVPPVAFIERWTATATALGDVELGPGEFIGVSTLGANRDPEVFEHPLRFDVRRENARHHLAFSFGAHHCLGFNMARLQGPIAVQAILDRLPGLELVEAPEPHGFAFRRPPELRLRWQT